MTPDLRNIIEAGAGQHPISVWEQEEFISGAFAAGVQPITDALKLPLSVPLPFRKLYFYVEALTSPAGSDYYVNGDITFSKGGQVQAKIPASIGMDMAGFLLTAKSIIGIVSPSEPFSPDAMRLVTSNKFTGGPDNVVIVPQHILCFADQVSYSIRSCKAPNANFVTNVRAFMGVLSSNHSY